MKQITSNIKLEEKFTISSQDRETLNSIIENREEQTPPTIFFSLTHIKHNYLTLTRLLNLAKLSKTGFNIAIVLWDMNILSNPYFKKVEFEHYKNWTTDQYLKKKKEEILSLAIAFGIKNIKVYYSSETWSRFMQQKDKGLFAKYYSVLSVIDLDESNINEKLNYQIQLPADVFFASFFHELYPEDCKKPIEAIYSSPARKSLYFATRKAMHYEGLTSTEQPVIILSKEIPRIEIDAQIPHWDMTASEIHQLLSKWRFEKSDIENLYKNAIGLILPEITIVTGKGKKKMKLDEGISQLSNQSRENIVASTSKNLFEYFQKIKEITKNAEEPKPDFHIIKTRKELKQLSALLKSENVMRILVLSNGNRTVSEIAKDTNMQLSNTSQYITKLKKAGLVKIKDKKVTRTTKGLKINFEISLGT